MMSVQHGAVAKSNDKNAEGDISNDWFRWVSEIQLASMIPFCYFVDFTSNILSRTGLLLCENVSSEEHKLILISQNYFIFIYLLLDYLYLLSLSIKS